MNNKQADMEYRKILYKEQRRLEAERKALTKKHEEYLKRDCEQIFAAMVLVLHQNGNTSDDIEELLNQIMTCWTEHVTTNHEQTMAEYAAEVTGIDVRQKVE